MVFNYSRMKSNNQFLYKYELGYNVLHIRVGDKPSLWPMSRQTIPWFNGQSKRTPVEKKAPLYQFNVIKQVEAGIYNV